MHKRRTKFQNHPSAGSGHLYMWVILFQQMIFLIAHIKTRKRSALEMMPSLDFKDHPQRLQQKGEETLERDETVPRVRRWDRWRQDHKVTQPGARRKGRGCCRSWAARSLHGSVYTVGLILFGWKK